MDCHNASAHAQTSSPMTDAMDVAALVPAFCQGRGALFSAQRPKPMVGVDEDPHGHKPRSLATIAGLAITRFVERNGNFGNDTIVELKVHTVRP